MSSREIAELTGKEHRNVLRDCQNLNESYEKLGLLKIEPSTYLNLQNKRQPQFELTKEQTLDLIFK
jgi:anti-repressor protein